MTEEELGSESFNNMSKITQWRVMRKIEYYAQWMQRSFALVQMSVILKVSFMLLSPKDLWESTSAWALLRVS